MFSIVFDPKLVPHPILGTKPCVVKHTPIKTHATTHHLIVVTCISFYPDVVSQILVMGNKKDLPPRSWLLIHPI